MPALTHISHSPVSLTLRFAIIALAVHGVLDLVAGVLAQEEHMAYVPLVQNPGSLEDRVAALEYKLANVVASSNAITVTGANLYVVNGTGTTDGEPNGLGNLVVGYNEQRIEDGDSWTDDSNNRSGSHMMVTGMGNNFPRFGGIVAGRRNSPEGEFSSVIGGEVNIASGPASVVCGGWGNRASGELSYVGGGEENEASGEIASAIGGVSNLAGGGRSSVTGGQGNTADGFLALAAGGDDNLASGWAAVVSGGQNNDATSDYASVAGGRWNVAAGRHASVSGGQNRTAPGEYNWVAGSLLEQW